MYVHAYLSMYVEAVGQPGAVAFLFPHVGSRERTPIVRLGGKDF